jgi:hypothetical protein
MKVSKADERYISEGLIGMFYFTTDVIANSKADLLAAASSSHTITDAFSINSAG